MSKSESRLVSQWVALRREWAALSERFAARKYAQASNVALKISRDCERFYLALSQKALTHRRKNEH